MLLHVGDYSILRECQLIRSALVVVVQCPHYTGQLLFILKGEVYRMVVYGIIVRVLGGEGSEGRKGRGGERKRGGEGNEKGRRERRMESRMKGRERRRYKLKHRSLIGHMNSDLSNALEDFFIDGIL